MLFMVLGMSGMMAQTVVCAGAGDVTIRQGSQLEINCDGEPITFNNDKIVLASFKDYDITIPELRKLQLTGAGDVESRGVLCFPLLDIAISGAGDAHLNVESDTIKAVITGVGDLELTGHCAFLQATITGLGDLMIDHLSVDSIAVLKTRNGVQTWDWKWESKNGHDSHGQNESGPHRSLWFNPHWNGVEAGLNMLIGPGSNGHFPGEYALLTQRPMNSWGFNFNIVDAGLAFTRTHRVGIYTGIGIGWNNFSFNNPVRLKKEETKLSCHLIDEATEGKTKLSKLGVMYLQAPLMLEFRPTRRSFIAIGVTGGFRINTWTKVKFQNGVKEKIHDDYYVNRFKLDASFRAGGENLGFFANFNLLPFFETDKAPTAHSLSFGLSLIF